MSEIAEENRGKPGRRKIVAKILLCSALLTWFGSSFLSEHYSRTRPAIENRAEGRVHLQNNHGSYTYLTAREHYLLMLLMIAAGASFLIGVLVYPAPIQWRALR